MKLFNLFNERKEQLVTQENIDIQLKKLNCICPSIVSEYLLLQRSITRNQQYKIINSNIIYIYDEMNNQLKVNNCITERFLNSFVDCDELLKIILEK
jgi:hypothetical protein